MTSNTEELKNCPFCGSDEIDPEGVSSIKTEYKDKTWSEVTVDMCESRPACDSCGASTSGNWNTRPKQAEREAELVKALEFCVETFEMQMGFEAQVRQGRKALANHKKDKEES